MEITTTLHLTNRQEWREWLTENHATQKEIWLIYYGQNTGRATIPYLHAVEEALCFGWIDGIKKKVDGDAYAQRFTPRRPKSHWTELNKDRVRRLIASGQMTEAGLQVLPDLTIQPLEISPDILDLLQADPQTWVHFQAFPLLYQRIRIKYIEDARINPAEFQKRLTRFLAKTKANKMFGSLE